MPLIRPKLSACGSCAARTGLGGSGAPGSGLHVLLYCVGNTVVFLSNLGSRGLSFLSVQMLQL